MPLSDDELRRRVEVYNRLERNISAAAREIGIDRVALKKNLFTAARRGICTSAPGTPSTPSAPLDAIERHRLGSEISRLRGICKSLTERLTAAEDHRASILGLEMVPAEPVAKPRVATKRAKHSGQAVVLHLSDLHVGEVVNREEVMGVNEYGLEIAGRRIGRLFNAAAILTTSAWPASDAAPVKVCVLLGGDLISGHGLHPEHAETDAGTAYQQTKWAAEYIAAGVLRLHLDLAERFGKPVPIELISVVGNHGRDTFGKPRTKLVSIQSYDTLVSDFVEASLKQYKTITHYRPRGFDAYFDAVGWPLLLTHGDRMGSGGGTGFIGPAATIIKGHRKILDTEHRQRRPVYKVFSGHFHTTCVTPFGFGNGSGIGYGEFAKSIRADPEPAQQNLVVFHERIGMLRWHPIAMGDPSEGSIYQPTAGLILPSMYEARG
jgi:hypothetical protein